MLLLRWQRWNCATSVLLVKCFHPGFFYPASRPMLDQRWMFGLASLFETETTCSHGNSAKSLLRDAWVVALGVSFPGNLLWRQVRWRGTICSPLWVPALRWWERAMAKMKWKNWFSLLSLWENVTCLNSIWPFVESPEVPNLFRKIKHGNFTLPGASI